MIKKIKIKNSHFKKKFEIKKNLKGDVFKILDKKSKIILVLVNFI